MINPKIRFKRDDGSEYPEWKKTTLANECALNPKTVSMPDEFMYMDLGSVDHGLWVAPKIIKKHDAPSRAQRVALLNDVFFQSVRPYNMGHYHYVNETEMPIVASTGYIQLRMNKGSNAFLYQMLYEDRFNVKVMNRCTGSNYPAINSSEFGNIPVNIPCLEEQQKIADFLSSVDDIITASEAEVKNLEEQKKGVMQKIFSQEVRFKAGDGSEYPEWNATPFGDLISEVSDRTKEENEDILLSSAIDGMFLNSELFGHQRGSSNKGYKKVAYGMLILSTQNLHLGNVNVNLRFEHGIVSPAYKTYNIIGCDIYYMAQWVKRQEAYNFFLMATTVGASACRRNVNWDTLYEQSIYLPCLEEQQKIADFLSTFDEAIEQSKKELEKWKELKKGLLQQMFV